MENSARILVPLDGSECSEDILPKVEELANSFKRGICLLRVVSARTFLSGDPIEAEVKVVREAEHYLEDLEQKLQAKGLDVDSHIRYGNDVEEIVEHAARKNIDMIAMSTHGHGGVKRFLFGNVVEKVLRHISKPVFLVRCAGSA